jgi:hypothetical protein
MCPDKLVSCKPSFVGRDASKARMEGAVGSVWPIVHVVSSGFFWLNRLESLPYGILKFENLMTSTCSVGCRTEKVWYRFRQAGGNSHSARSILQTATDYKSTPASSKVTDNYFGVVFSLASNRKK